MDLGIAGRRALVCGASRGLGFACAEALAGEGVHVVLAARDTPRLLEAAARIEAATGERPAIVAADLATVDGRLGALAACPEPDILVTNGGGPPAKDFRALTLEDWSRALDANFLAAAELIRMTVDGMAGRGFGRIVNITSMTVRVPVERLDLSTAARLALTGYAASVCRQVAVRNVTINNLLPGTILTERIKDLGAMAERLIARVPAGRAGDPREFGEACAFLCGARSGFITGQNLLVDGGLCALTV
ncbi:SDR family oxidoreductase [Phreatobacter stygius]|uniref:SDR family oxidoreductase n=1 Tax=Phreatobacter stygius TaxID=1940610 RepID=A0A4D7AT38_9HYPH|nr:SDR family oxidoreductase [Phreatobacter stygius]QCI64684.1 SDR family oxidoreductase [Phreatobacter stygius]